MTNSLTMTWEARSSAGVSGLYRALVEAQRMIPRSLIAAVRRHYLSARRNWSTAGLSGGAGPSWKEPASSALHCAAAQSANSIQVPTSDALPPSSRGDDPQGDTAAHAGGAWRADALRTSCQWP